MFKTWRGSVLTSLLLVFTLFVATGCSDPNVEKAAELLKQASTNVAQLKASLEKDELSNAKILTQYADHMRQKKPDLNKIIDTLATETTPQGGMYTMLSKRLTTAEDRYRNEGGKSRDALFGVIDEASSIAAAASPDVFNDALVDVVNVLADMSGGELPNLKFDDKKTNEMPASQHLVGNPTYGEWKTGSNGGSFWVWYGQYRLLSDMIGGGRDYRYERDSWYRDRPATYYGDVGRHYYGTGRNNADWSTAAKRNPTVAVNKAPEAKVKTFKSANRLSTYAPKTQAAPKAMTAASSSTRPGSGSSGTYAPKRQSTYANTRSAPSRSGGMSGSRGGK